MRTLLIVLGFLILLSVTAKSDPDFIKTKQIFITDSDGKIRMGISAPKDLGPSIVFTDKKGKTVGAICLAGDEIHIINVEK